MIEVKEAVGIAVHFLAEVFKEGQCQNIRLEEVVLTDDEKYWLVTLSFVRGYPRNLKDIASALSGEFSGPREYKRIKVNTETGQVQAMVIRDPNSESAQAH